MTATAQVKAIRYPGSTNATSTPVPKQTADNPRAFLRFIRHIYTPPDMLSSKLYAKTPLFDTLLHPKHIFPFALI